MMKCYVVTGITGLLGGNFLWEVIKNNITDLDNIRIFCLGRSSDVMPIGQRINQLVNNGGLDYFANGLSNKESMAEKVCNAITPIAIDLKEDKMNLKEEDFLLLKKNKIDYFVHIAAITDFRNTPNVTAELEKINYVGTKKIIDLVGSLDNVENFFYVSSVYSCGMTFGNIKPDYINLNQEFRNPYENIKLKAEIFVRSFCENKKMNYKIFRPSTIGGRIFEKPLGHVTKYDVFYEWCVFFLSYKLKIIGKTHDISAMYDKIEIPVRICCNPDSGLNIIPADYAAKVMYGCVEVEHKCIDYHLVSTNELNHYEYIPAMIKTLNIDGLSLVSDRPANLNRHEKLYYRTVGSIYTPYIENPPMLFDYDSMAEVCSNRNLPVNNVDIDQFNIMIEYAKKNNFGITPEKKNRKG